MAKGFKEWQVVCDALASGRQAIILRKGGIHEGREGFRFAEESFFLFPTRFHNQSEFVREGEVKVAPEWEVGDRVEIGYHVTVPWARTLTNWAEVEALSGEHIWTEETVRQRFDWEGKGMSAGSIHVALVRVSRLMEAWSFDYEKKYGGCRSWVEIPEPPVGWEVGKVPVMDNAAFAALESKLERAVA
ncbi:hypothetical protein HNR46_002079 [Haloferula luteola]|uniref:DUF1802 family protein n=1 Tax=Haloferula luteola TaxID=595692 RepID=A0A840VD72_9BACT|nr:DUF1802 family protein [Haloferula luteola]MBB5351840.1 hypothetical protein [Haloferula luteola]